MTFRRLKHYASRHSDVTICIVRPPLQRLCLAILFTVCMGAPLLEISDRWDHTLQDGNDTETNLVVVVLCVGVGFIAAAAIIRRVRPSLTDTFHRISCRPLNTHADSSLILPIPHASPPAALRV
jgi:hypothetical protein